VQHTEVYCYLQEVQADFKDAKNIKRRMWKISYILRIKFPCASLLYVQNYLGGTCNAFGGTRGVFKAFVWKLEGKRPLGRETQA